MPQPALDFCIPRHVMMRKPSLPMPHLVSVKSRLHKPERLTSPPWVSCKPLHAVSRPAGKALLISVGTVISPILLATVLACWPVNCWRGGGRGGRGDGGGGGGGSGGW
jgi:hypothetical protein